MTAPEQLTLEAGGLTFGALAWGDRDAPPALLVHGYPDTAWTWRHLGPYLAERGWRAVAPFTRGYGPTDLAPDGSYRVADLAGDLLALHTALGGDDRAVLVGHDWGAVATYAVTAREPGRFARYVTLAIPPTRALLKPLTRLSTVPLGLAQTRLSWYFAYNQLPAAVGGMDRVVPRHWRAWSPGYDATEDVARFFAAVDRPERRRAVLSYYRDNLRGGLLATFSITPGAPVLYLHGADDGCMKASLAERFPETLAAGSRHEVLDGVGHFLQLEAPERVNPLIADWLGTPG